MKFISFELRPRIRYKISMMLQTRRRDTISHPFSTLHITGMTKKRERKAWRLRGGWQGRMPAMVNDNTSAIVEAGGDLKVKGNCEMIKYTRM